MLKGHPTAGQPDQWRGNIVVDLTNIGTWKRTLQGGHVEVEIRLAPGATATQRRLVDEAADRLSAFLGLERR